MTGDVVKRDLLDWGTRRPPQQEMRMLVAWGEMTQVLKDSLPQELLEYNKHCVDLQMEQQGATVAFQVSGCVMEMLGAPDTGCGSRLVSARV